MKLIISTLLVTVLYFGAGFLLLIGAALPALFTGGAFLVSLFWYYHELIKSYARTIKTANA